MSERLDQLGGLPMWTRARTDDPDTSHKAAESMADSAVTQRAHIHTWLSIHGPATADAIDEALGLRVTSAGRRLSELETMGRVRRTDKRAPTRSGRDAIIWEGI